MQAKRFGFRHRWTLVIVTILLALGLLVGALQVVASPVHERNSGVDDSIVSGQDLDYVRENFAEFEGEEVVDFAATAFGVVLRLESGIVSVGGEDWEEQWRYSRRETVDSVDVAPDGGYIYVSFEGVTLPWSSESGVRLYAGDGSPSYEYSLGDFVSDPRSGEFYYSQSTMWSVVATEETEIISAYDLESGEEIWEFPIDNLCSHGEPVLGEGKDVYPTERGIILGLQCMQNSGNEQSQEQVVAHLAAADGATYWRREWSVEDAESALPNVFYLNDASVPGSEDDLLGRALLASGDLEYAFISDNSDDPMDAEFWTPDFLEDEVVREELHPPLSDGGARPDVLIVGMPDEIEVQVAVQVSRILAGDSSFPVDEADFSLLQLRRNGRLVDVVGYRHWELLSSEIQRTFLNDLHRALEGAGPE
ncbi:hypothetical protein ACIBFB_24640 [Nocardiopsis sp. NPDC050513]|uniref:hypothetical protein n=1 Tax=Nocardiopsis sp. NPDC050513 TaxID=3364338 RepID=UPI00379A9E2B